MIGHYLSTALQSFRRRPLNAAIKLLALALGLACLLTAHTIGDYFRQADSQWAKADRTYVIEQQIAPPGGEWQDTQQMSSLPVAKYLRADFPELETVAQMRFQNFPLRAADQTGGVTGLPVDPEFLNVFDLDIVAGAADLTTPRSVLLAETRATAMFGDEDPIGKTLTTTGGIDLTVTGVYRDFPSASHLGLGGQMYLFALPSFDSWVDDALAQNPDQPRWWEQDQFLQLGAVTYVVVREGATLDEAAFNRRLAAFVEQRVPPGPYQMRLRAIPMPEVMEMRFNSRVGMPAGFSLTLGLYVLGALTLAVGCLNFANLSAAEAVTRAQEIGLRKTVGARRRQVAALALCESLILAAAALALVLPLTGLIATAITSRFNITVSLPDASRLDYWIGVAAIAVAAAVAAGLYPALVLANLRPVFALRMRPLGGRSSLARTALIGMQFAVAAVLISLVFVMLAQNASVRATALRPGLDPLAIAPVPPTPTLGQVTPADFAAQAERLESLRTQLMADPAVKAVTFRSSPPFSSPRGQEANYARSLEPGAPRFQAQARFVYYDYFETLDVPLVAGRTFDRDRNDSLSAIIDVGTARRMGLTPEQAIGQPIHRFATPTPAAGAEEASVQYTVIGVVEREPYDLQADGASNYVYVNLAAAGVAVMQIDRNNVQGAVMHVPDVLVRMNVQNPFIEFVDQAFERSYNAFFLITGVFVVLSAIALAIAAMGLFGMASLVVQRRLREIGVRKTLGANSLRVMGLMLWDYSRPVILANLIALPFAIVAARFYLGLFVNRIPLTPLPFLLALGASLAIAWIAVSVHAVRAASVKPALVLKTE